MSDTSFPDDIYQYADRAQAALLGMIRDVMQEAAENGLAGGHHFYLTFNTHTQGVEMSDKLRAAHPEEITIVLQNQYEDFTVDEAGFSVTLYFNQVPEAMVVPWPALSKFYDPSVAFGLMFDVDMPEDDAADMMVPENILIDEMDEEGLSETSEPRGEVVSLDSFRDK